MPVRPEIALGVRQPKFLTPADALTLKDLATRSDLHGLQLEEAHEERGNRNALRQIYGDAANVDTGTGALKPEAIRQVGAINPALAGKLSLDQLNASVKQAELASKQAETAERQGKVVAQKEEYLNANVRGPAFAAYEAALPQGEETARRAGQAAFTQGLEAASRSGMFGIEEKGQFAMDFDPQRVSQRLQQSKDWIAQRGATAERAERERHNRATEAQRIADAAAAERRARDAAAREKKPVPPAGYRFKEDGSLEVIKGGPAEAKTEKRTDAENISAGYASRMNASASILNSLEDKGVGKPEVMESLLSKVPISGKVASNLATSTDRQLYRQAQEDWVRAKLRKESGAVIADEEMDREIRVYFPQMGDAANTVKQKRASRKVAEKAMEQSAGRAEVQGAKPSSKYTEGQTATGPGGKQVVFKNGNWVPMNDKFVPE